MKVIIDSERCMGNGLCASILPAVFQVTDDGVAELVSVPVDEMREKLRDAARICPTQAITLED